MVTSVDCWKKYGNPFKERNMIIWTVPNYMHFSALPKKIYCNKDLVIPLTNALSNLMLANLTSELKTWDGCFNIRSKRGSKSISLHSWGIAIDVNAAWNRFGKKGNMSKEFARCFTDAGFDWGRSLD